MHILLKLRLTEVKTAFTQVFQNKSLTSETHRIAFVGVSLTAHSTTHSKRSCNPPIDQHWFKKKNGQWPFCHCRAGSCVPLMMLLLPAPLTWTTYISLQLFQLRAVRTPGPEVTRCPHKTTAVSTRWVPATSICKMDWLMIWNYSLVKVDYFAKHFLTLFSLLIVIIVHKFIQTWHYCHHLFIITLFWDKWHLFFLICSTKGPGKYQTISSLEHIKC